MGTAVDRLQRRVEARRRRSALQYLISLAGPPDEARDDHGRWTAGGSSLASIPAKGRPDGSGSIDDPIFVGDNLDRARELLAQGKHIRLDQPDELATLLDKVNESVQQAKAKGEDAPTFDMCNVSVTGTNLFCAETKGIPRAEMPQLQGTALPGTPAAEKVGAGNQANMEPEFLAMLDKIGVSATPETVLASHLRATQSQLDGKIVAGLSAAIERGEPKAVKAGNDPIYVTKDNYIIDGHHRWAAKVAVDVQDGKVGNPEDNVTMHVVRLNMDIGHAIDLTNAFATVNGVKSQKLGAVQPKDHPR